MWLCADEIDSEIAERGQAADWPQPLQLHSKAFFAGGTEDSASLFTL